MTHPHQTRRDWLKTASAVLLTADLLSTPSANAPKYAYIPALPPDGSNPPLPPGKTVPFDWPYAEIPAGGEGLRLTWPAATRLPTGPALFRLTSATDVREVCQVDVLSGKTDRVLGEIDMRFAHYHQPFEWSISAADLPEILSNGLRLRLKTGTKQLWIFCATPDGGPVPPAFLPHLFAGSGSETAWQERLLSLDSVQTFGWMEGCVLDGIQAMVPRTPRAQGVLGQHLDLFFGNDRFRYETLNNERSEGRIHTVESLLPFAILAQTNPAHPALRTAVEFALQHADANGVIADGTGPNRMIKTEECYTISYPLAVLAKRLAQPRLAELAAQTALARVQGLRRGNRIYQRGVAGQEPFFENWARGVAWYLLGLARTLAHLPPGPAAETLKTDFRQAADAVMGYQQGGGLWACFLHQPETGLETSGSAGIAAALAVGHRQGLLPESARRSALRAQRALGDFLTPDGFLKGTAQVNKGGEGLQRGGFRVISPYTLGFLGQLDAALG